MPDNRRDHDDAIRTAEQMLYEYDYLGQVFYDMSMIMETMRILIKEVKHEEL